MAVPLPTTEKGRVTRARIVGAAAGLVAEQGVAAVSLDEVGARAAASRSQLYHYFEDRDDLIRAVVAETVEAVLGAQDELLDALDTWAGIDRWFAAMVAGQEARQACGGCPIGSLAGQLAERDPAARAALAVGFDRWEARLREGLLGLQARSRLAPRADPAQLATSVMALIQGGLLLTQVRRDAGQLRIALDAARALLRAAAG